MRMDPRHGMALMQMFSPGAMAREAGGVMDFVQRMQNAPVEREMLQGRLQQQRFDQGMQPLLVQRMLQGMRADDSQHDYHRLRQEQLMLEIQQQRQLQEMMMGMGGGGAPSEFSPEMIEAFKRLQSQPQ